jgi:FAD:protein FMN transferase
MLFLLRRPLLSLLAAALAASAAAPAPPPASPGEPSGAATEPATTLAAPAATAGPVHPLRADAPAFGATLDVEVRDLPLAAADAAIQAVVVEVRDVERLADADRPESALAALNAAVGKGPQRIDPRLFDALARALDFCIWSDGKQGPLARDLHRAWGRGADVPLASPPSLDVLRQAVAAAACRHLTLDPSRKTAARDAGSALDLADFAAGMALDRAVVVLRQHGAANAFVQIGALRRGIGAGRDGRGWIVEIPAIGGLVEPIGRVYLRDQALAIAARDEHPLRVGGQALSPYINQRTGFPAEGIMATLVASELAIDAQALAATMAITGSAEGEMLMGSIRPRPAILWLMGSGSGTPLLVDYRWSEVPKR